MGLNGHEVRTRTFRWREITVRDAGASNQAVVEVVAEAFGDKQLNFIKVDHMGPQQVNIAYRPAFTDRDREIIYEKVKAAFPKANIGFYGEESLTILRSAVCLDKYIQGSDS